ncbi:nodulation protein NodH [Pseudoruegeria sp. SHC-113]|uniref:nodulation protein NodH n=1 Tax=Pseudoruegeria sp. SHC-113 TaxID=2855439 RepID=UPI0021BBA12A|nr:nodulation protein NodH [Pseudoruegeria sp. SHC-113]MCT8158513.1 nodulation protein NodH [Pseudoruegeria sp. SHC-113]
MGGFSYFVILAGMRTGSNFLESNLNAFPDLTCHGEAYNPHFIGYPKRDTLLGLTAAQRDADPLRLLAAMRAESGVVPGFRFFHDHDPRILAHVLGDPACAKIVLTRNTLESYVSWKIAQETGQWKLTNVKHHREAQVRFDAAEFQRFQSENAAFHAMIRNALQETGQGAFWVDYSDLQSLEVINGLGAYLGAAAPLPELQKNLKRQNPGSLRDKVKNADEMEAALARFDIYGLGVAPQIEPARNAGVPNYLAAEEPPLLFQPIPAGPTARVRGWMEALAGAEGLTTGMTQKDLRQWLRRNKAHRGFTVVSHPLTRAHRVFCERILPTGEGAFLEIRGYLGRAFEAPMPEEGVALSPEDHRACFAAFLKFVKANLAGQTPMRMDPAFATQAAVIHGFSQVIAPDLIIREATLELGLAYLAAEQGIDAPRLAEEAAKGPDLAEIYDADLEKLCKDVYGRDYLAYGFKPWDKR